MPKFTSQRLYTIAYQILHAAGAPRDYADTVASHLADANLTGHDSHGFIRVPQYVREIREGLLDPRAQPEIVRESTGTAQVNGNGTFGQVVASWATELAIEKARQSGISMVTIGNLAHTGRLGAYPEMAAQQGMAAIMCTGLIGGRRGRVAPFGGRAGRLGTNPIAMSFPHAPDSPVLLDFATSMAAEGKLRVYMARGEPLPSPWIINNQGVPSREPNELYDGGAILPMGGLDGGHKGYALSFMIALFGSILGKLGCPEVTSDSLDNGSSLIVINIGGMAPIEGIRAQVEELVAFVKDTPPMEGSSGVFYPGEIEARSRQEKLAKGIEVEQSTWEQVAQLITEYGLDEELGVTPGASG